MALSREDWIDITRHLQQHVRDADPEVFELLARHVDHWNDPQRYLIDYLDGLIKIMSERSSGTTGRILNELNHWVRTEEGGPVRGIRLVLSPAERQSWTVVVAQRLDPASRMLGGTPCGRAGEVRACVVARRRRYAE